MDATHTNSSLKICVKKCPEENVLPADVEKFHESTGNAFCMTNRRGTANRQFCPRGPIYKSTERLMMCIPDVLLSKSVGAHEIGTLLNSTYMLLQYFIADLVTIRYDILPFCLFSLGTFILQNRSSPRQKRPERKNQ
ncbi:unnamed protein product [Gongylonema pulchrum]|uniref:Uncharacterized protein n=1 Tax=Gongylonema pulchrum TaxID=637853 RepID=A0A3P7QK85_9BILA|nr:unnamed protein product [Gongylonema pulchrum]